MESVFDSMEAMENYFGYRITMRKETYTRTKSGKSWKTKPDTIETETVSKEFYDNYIGSCTFFNNFGYGASCRKYYGYSYIGYIPINVVTVSPYREKKIVAWFKFSKLH